MTSNTPPQLGNHGSPNTVLPDPTTENEGFRAYKAGLAAGRAEGTAAERKRIRQLARDVHASYCLQQDGKTLTVLREFADLLTEGETT